MMRYALAGNPNAGKTTLFNDLTGSNQHVGNWPGVTVERKEGELRKKYSGHEEVTIVDLPGVYSLNPHSIEERVTRAYIVVEKPDVVINVVEATNLERNLFLTCQIAELGVPVVVALNMMDEAEKIGDCIDVEKLSKRLGIPVIPITAVKGEGVIKLMQTAGSDELIKMVDYEAGHPFHEGEDEHGHGFQDIEDPLQHRQEHHTDEQGRTNALIAELKYHNHYKGPKVWQAADNEPLDDVHDSENARLRYEFIEEIVGDCVTHANRKASGRRGLSEIDKILTHRITGIPIFLAVVFLMFHTAFSSDFLGLSFFGLSSIPSPGIWLQTLAQLLINDVSGLAGASLEGIPWVHGLVIDGIIGGVGTVLSFLPQILIIFFFLTLLEDIGYMSRVAFLADRIMAPFGLSGKSFLPLLMGFGCSVPALMATRTMENERDRRMTMFMIPFMSCSARTPIYLVFTSAFFPNYTGLIMFALYVLGITVALSTAAFLGKFVMKQPTTPLLIELPRYRAPRLKSLWMGVYSSGKDYISKAGSIIFLMSIAVWFLSAYGVADGGIVVADADSSFLASIGKFITPFFGPLGFGFWQAAVALLAGFVAKEAVVSTLGVLVGSSVAAGAGTFSLGLAAIGFTPLSSLTFMVFALLYVPCLATIATLAREYNSWKWTVSQVTYSIVIAWIAAFIVHSVGKLIGMA